MFLKYLKIENKYTLIRTINFKPGLNLIVDETPNGNEETGNNVGKTTVIRLIDFCLGLDGKKLYTVKEGSNVINEEVRDFLIDTNVVVTLCLADGFENEARKVIIRRDFIKGKRGLVEINGEKVEKKYFNEELQKAIWGEVTTKPTFRQIISHNFRYDDDRLSNTLRTLGHYTSDVEYETLHLYMFGCNFEDGDRKQEIDKKLKTDYAYKRRLEKDASKSALRSKLSFVKDEIKELDKKKKELHLNPDFEKDLDLLTNIKSQLSHLAVQQSSLKLRYSLIQEAIDELKSQETDIDFHQLELIYNQASALIGGLQHTFEELVAYHNEMLLRKEAFISVELPKIKKDIDHCNDAITALRIKEKQLADKLQQSATMEELEEMVVQINQKYQEKGALEQRIDQINNVEKKIESNEAILNDIDKGLFSNNKKELIQKQLEKFNKYYSAVSKRLYNESYAIEFNLVKNKDGKYCYKFSPFATDNFSTGKKQGEITCFDMAYIMFADDEGIPCLHFILNDRKELVHGNQLLRIGSLANEHSNIQYVASILRDKLPSELNKKEYIILTLSQSSKLFRIEELQNKH